MSVTSHKTFLISNFRLVLNVVCFLLGNSPASEFYMPTFPNTLSHLHRQVSMKYTSHLPTYEDGTLLHTYLLMQMEQKECSETSEYKIQTPGNYPVESIQHSHKTFPFVCCITILYFSLLLRVLQKYTKRVAAEVTKLNFQPYKL